MCTHSRGGSPSPLCSTLSPSSTSAVVLASIVMTCARLELVNSLPSPRCLQTCWRGGEAGSKPQHTESVSGAGPWCFTLSP